MPTIRGASPHNVAVVFEGNVDELDRLKASNIPNSRYNKTVNGWTVRASYLNLQRVVKAWPNAMWDKEAGTLMAGAEANHLRRQALLKSKDVDFSELEGFPFKDPQPWDHQKTALLLGRDADLRLPDGSGDRQDSGGARRRRPQLHGGSHRGPAGAVSQQRQD